MCFVNFYYTVLVINIIYKHAIFPRNSGFPTLQIDSIGVFSLLDMNGSSGMVLYNLLWRVFLWPYGVKYFLHQYLRYCLLSFDLRIFHYLTHYQRFFTVSAEKTVNTFRPKFYIFRTTLVPNFMNFWPFFNLLNYKLINF